jgi:hypothetical protein
MIAGCKSRGNTILPIIPDETYSFSDKPAGINPGDIQDRYSYQNTSNVKLIVTGPEEYLSSKLTPPLVTANLPTFSARIENIDSEITSENFYARVDGEAALCDFNKTTSEVSFSPNTTLKDGSHHATLHFRNPKGSSRMVYWSFILRTVSPTINMVMWNEEKQWALVIFNEAVEPSSMLDASRWTINNESNILRSKVASAGNNMAMLPLNTQTFERYTLKSALSISFRDNTGQADYAVFREGEYRKVQAECNCDDITFEWLDEHSELEAGAEKYAIAYRLYTPPNPCSLRMEWDGWTRTPIANHNPKQGEVPGTEGFDLDEDYICLGTPETGDEDVPYPESFSLLINPDDINTISFDRLYTHSVTVSVKADCDRDGEYEKEITSRTITFSASKDCTNPQFDHAPEVLYGDEVADKVELWMKDIPMYGEPIYDDQYCFSIERGDSHDPYPTGFSGLMKDLRDNHCRLFILTKASDPVSGEHYGNMPPQLMVLDIKRSDGTCEYGNIVYEPVTGVIVIDHKPWAGPVGASGDRELVYDWPDPKYKQSPDGMWHDWCGEETSVFWWDLTDILLDPVNQLPGKDITDIRVRLTDNTPDMRGANAPPGEWTGYKGNWKRSENILEQLCDFTEREGDRYAQADVCTNKLKIRFIDKNPHDGDSNWKVVNYDGNTDSSQTSFIYTRDSSGNAYINLFLHLNVAEPIDQSEPIKVRIRSSESSLPLGMGNNYIDVNVKPMISYEIIPGGKERLMQLFETENDCDCFYYAEIAISDTCMTSASGGGLFCPECPTLYVSSSDAQYDDDYDSKMDYAAVAAYRNVWGVPGNITTFQFGKSRGSGYFEPASAQKIWYSYDEFITSGGIEVIKVEKIFGRYNLDDPHGKDKPAVAVQSEADVLLVVAHGLKTRYAEPTAGFGPLSYPIYQNPPHPRWETQAKYHWVDDCLRCQPEYYTDYGNIRPWLWWGDEDDRGNFWQKKSRNPNDKELRWLTMVGCGTLSPDGTPSPVENWRAKLRKPGDTEGYLSSVCGFTVDLDQFPINIPMYDFVITGALVSRYGNNMEVIYKKPEIRTYEPNVRCFRFDPFWKEGKGTRDISVAAYMEAACDLVGNTINNEFYSDMGLNEAVAIDKDNVTGGYYYWYLSADDVNPYFRNNHNYSMKIDRKDL